jgi:tungstate transport system ATP-binding protein
MAIGKAAMGTGIAARDSGQAHEAARPAERELGNRLLYAVEHLTHRYGDRQVLNIPRLEVWEGEILALVGPSGAGKSTLLRLLNFLEAPTSGTIQFHDAIITTPGNVSLEVRRKITMVFQRPLLRSTTVLHNTAYGLKLRRVPRAQEIAAEALASLGLQHLASKPARTLSGGEMQRVALARAMVIQPEVLLLDEPTANLDPYNINLIEQAILKMHQEQHNTIVMVTHNVFQARRLASRVALLLEGQIVESADVETFFEAPRDARTAAFLRGDMVY